LILKPECLSWEEIRNKAEKFREQYVNPIDTIPVPIEEIIELQLDIKISPKKNLIKSSDIEAALTRDLTTIIIDYDIYMEERYESRRRFTFAHEIAHIILHSSLIKKCDWTSEEEWIICREEFDETNVFWFEQQAYEFAGRLLVPLKQLGQEIKTQKEKIKKFLENCPDINILPQGIAYNICKKFGVSDQVIVKRIKNENINIEELLSLKI